MLEGIKKDNIIIYGCGGYGEIALRGLENLGMKPRYFLDRKFAGQNQWGVPVRMPEDGNIDQEACYLVAVGNAHNEVCEFLQSKGCKHLYNLEEIFAMEMDTSVLSSKAEYFWVNKHLYYDYIHKPVKGEIFLHHLDFVTTEKCTLKCRDCAHLNQYYIHPADVDLDSSIAALDRMFMCIDYLSEIRILGGEPLINRECWKVVQYISQQPKCGQAVIYTNGTVLPDKKTLQCIKEGMAVLHVSNYGVRTEVINKNLAFYRENNCKLYNDVFDTWLDLGGIEKRDYEEDALQRIFDKCQMRKCLNFHGTKMYSCSRIGGLLNCGLLEDPAENREDEWVDFSGEINPIEKREELKYLLNRKKPFESCRHCNGYFDAGKVPAGIQIAT